MYAVIFANHKPLNCRLIWIAKRLAMTSRYLLVKMNRLFRLVFVWEPYAVTIMFQAESS